MLLYLVHHGDAVPAEVDAQRPLSTSGRAAVERLAQEAARLGARPAVIWHSGKLRARQTAEAYWRVCNPLAEFSAVRGLRPDDPLEWIADVLAAEERDVMVVGHMPHLERLRARLLKGTAHEADAFPQHGIIAIDRLERAWAERWRLAP